MANESNLIPKTTLSKEEAKAMGRKGGLASVASRRAKKNLSERIKLALTISTNENLKSIKREIKDCWPNRRMKDNKTLLKTLIAQAKTIRECGIDVYNILKIAERPESQEIGMKAASMLWDREEGKPVQSQNVNHAGEIKGKTIFVEEKLTNKMESHITDTIDAD